MTGDAACRRKWVLDVATEHAALTTTGGQLWDAARRLASFLEEMGDELGLHRPGVTILELGSGLGWLGMTLARNLPDAGMVVVTEQETGGGLDWLRHNISLNSHLPGQAALRAEACDWLLYGAEGGAVDGSPREDGGSLLAHGAAGAERQGGEASASASGSEGMIPAPLESKDGHGPTVAVPPVGPRPTPSGQLAESTCGSGDGQVGEHLSVLGPRADDDIATCSDGAGARNPGGGDGGCSVSGGERGLSGGGGGDGCIGDGGGTDAHSSGGGRGGDCLSSQRWDLILGSDLVYNDVGAVYLPRVMRSLAHPGTRIIYCHTKHRFDTYDIKFQEQLAAWGLACREVHEPSVASPPPSPPPLTELFPEMRIAVYDIRLTS